MGERDVRNVEASGSIPLTSTSLPAVSGTARSRGIARDAQMQVVRAGVPDLSALFPR